MKTDQKYTGMEIAVTGMACRFPGSANWREYWDNLANGVESIDHSGPAPAHQNGAPFVSAKAALKDKELFDFTFFDYSVNEAKLLNPVHRVFHECVWEALEDAGYDPDQVKGAIGLFAGAGDDLNWKIYSTLKNGSEDVDQYTLHLINNKDFLAPLVAYKLNLKGPALTVNTACSTSLVAISLACRSLLLGESKMALAGGVSVITREQNGYYHQEGMILSADGHCRAFDKDASGTISGEGAGVVVLKRLADALKEGDHIYAIIKGSAVNNDGKRKVGFTAPSVEGQSECIRKAHVFARVEPDTISYIETHGTGTKMGDPIELEALNLAFNRDTKRRCAIGSVKTNMGHIDAAAGVAGFIKTVLSLQNAQLPPSLHFAEQNPEVNFAGGPFYVNTSLQQWTRVAGQPLRAGVSSFGIGGTNVHTILEEAPTVENSGESRRVKLLSLSARTPASLKRYMERLGGFLEQEPAPDLADMCYTFHLGRRAFTHRKSIAFTSKEDLLRQLKGMGQPAKSLDRNRQVVFLFPGQGSQYSGMCRGLYEQEPSFREMMDKGFGLLKKLTGQDFKELLFSTEHPGRINETRYAQPLIFLVEFALARLLISLGITPASMTGHSIGEYTAACISGVFEFEDALRLVVKRGELMFHLPSGAMLSAALDAKDAEEYTNETISLAAVNGPSQVVFSGSHDAINTLMERLQQQDTACTRLHTSHAFHSHMQEPVLEEFGKELRQMTLNKPTIPFISNLTGDLISEEDAMSADYWVRHLRHTVRFSDGVQTLLSKHKEMLGIEVGPGHSLSALVRQHRKAAECVSLVRSAKQEGDDELNFTSALGQLWSAGAVVNWSTWYEKEKRKRIPLPTYCFEPVPHPTEVNPFAEIAARFNNSGSSPNKELKDWLYYPTWKRSAGDLPSRSASGSCLLLATAHPFFQKLKKELEGRYGRVTEVLPGDEYEKGPGRFVLDPTRTDHFQLLASDLEEEDVNADIIYGWGTDAGSSGSEQKELSLVFMGMVKLLQALLKGGEMQGRRITFLTNRLHLVTGSERSCGYTQAPLLGLVNTATQELGATCFNIDADLDDESAELPVRVAEEIISNEGREERIVAYRHGRRWVQEYGKSQTPLDNEATVIQPRGVYLITGGLGNVGFILARHLAQHHGATVVLTGRKRADAEEVRKRLASLQVLDGSVHYFQADVSDRGQLEAVTTQIENSIGPVRGVVHTAGIIDHKYFELIEDITEQNTLTLLMPKVRGIENIYEVFGNRRPDFVWITSSLASVVGGLGYSSYSAANLYMDHFVSSKADQLRNWKCVGLAEMVFTEEENAPGALKPSQIAELFDRSLAVKESGVIVETVEELSLRLKKLYEQKEQLGAATAEKETEDAFKLERPEMSTDYVAPETETETKLQQVFERFFGMDRIGTEDGFFELGGDSLKAMILLKKIKNEFNVNITMADFFEKPTIRELAFYIDEVHSLLQAEEPASGKIMMI
jgi:phthiocerol/phenolphthiocerol synthesis type-I polyketide synthase E